LLQTLRVQTVAEGIETAEQLEYMAAMGVDRAQGFYFARPMPAPALRERFAVPAYAG
jgi:EAL domain-containing protein (putative c-di-GMP-specific phosphodiesterase class I)